MAKTGSESGARTPRQEFWLEHLRACREQGISLKAYAREHDLSVSALYAAKSALKRQGALAERSVAVPPPTFVPVRIARRSSAFRVLLPNGVVVEVAEPFDAAACRELLAAAGALA